MKVAFNLILQDLIVIAVKVHVQKVLKNSCNAIGALINHKLLTVGLFECTVTTEVFEGWVEHDLLPKLKKKSVLIMDNASFHKGRKLQELLKKAGHYLVWLPKYSPDLNPIEKM